MSDDELLAHLQRQAAQRRKHATFFTWYDRSADGKAVPETVIVSTLLDAMAEEGVRDYSNARPSVEDWPDCWVDAQNAGKVPVEVSELVDQAALPAGTARPWSIQEVRDRLQSIISRKDESTRTGRRSREVVLVITTDEPYLDSGTLTDALEAQPFQIRHANLARAFLLFSYDPKSSRYPFIELRLEV
jgi:hypothetical protein